ncbi:spheroidene monooxygenase [Blastococcus sp. DSM 46786]|uniref:monooxygenase n=1 Tax=Blastococcus sp. DSM 46786 TaxID=1798227 RepID=UPI0008AADB0D|nr:monooxygenase [Blastococcus sp. DSM 46786]SEK58892.1 spheroidene monooxygenase [Blastococcus sp. DSM 46786]
MTLPAVVTLHLWQVSTHAIPRALVHMAADRRPLRRTPGLRFAKLLGTGSGRTFTVRDADPRQWGLLAVWDDPAAPAAFQDSGPPARWRRFADEEWVAHLEPLSARGLWSGQEPFGRPRPRVCGGPVAAITRARLVLRRAARFWTAVPPVSADLLESPGLRMALGIGEAPLGLQGTFSLWDSSSSLNAFAYGRSPHTAVIERTHREGWYAEELFARFAVRSSSGTIAGVEPLGPAPR